MHHVPLLVDHVQAEVDRDDQGVSRQPKWCRYTGSFRLGCLQTFRRTALAAFGQRALGRGGEEPERRGHASVLYADDLNAYVWSQRAGERVKTSLQAVREGQAAGLMRLRAR